MEWLPQHWLDWLALTLVAFGVGAGAVRGLVQQSIRVLVLSAALALAGLGGVLLEKVIPSVHWDVLDNLLTRPASLPTAEMVLFVVFFAVLNLLRGVLFFWAKAAGGWISRVLGALVGVAGAALVLTLVAAGAAWFTGPQDLPPPRSQEVTGRILASLRRAPRPPLPLFLANVPPEPAPADNAGPGNPSPDPKR